MRIIFKLLVSGLAIALFALFSSCGARKVNKDQSKEETHSNITDNSTIEKRSDTNVKTTTTVNVDDKNETVTEETVYEPKDPAKESFVIEKDGTKTVLNNVKKTVKKTTQKNNTATSAIIAQVQNENKAVKEQKAIEHKEVSAKEVKAKEVDKKQFNPFVSVCIGFFGLILIWCIYRFYKKLPLVPKL